MCNTWGMDGLNLEAICGFLTARLNEREAMARAALRSPENSGRWSTDIDPWGSRVVGDGIEIYDEGGHTEEQAVFIAANDPAFVLADIAAKRAIIATYSDVQLSEDGRVLGGAGPEVYYEILRRLAQPFAEHPGYRQEWVLCWPESPCPQFGGAPDVSR